MQIGRQGMLARSSRIREEEFSKERTLAIGIVMTNGVESALKEHSRVMSSMHIYTYAIRDHYKFWANSRRGLETTTT